ncbi:acyltransferase [Mesorhizobium sp. M1006]|uniref:acyltransferase n=1 Tax=Mesorhizobium sp. M1006 TaxID=2957048 RepID=UPI00333ADD47
MTLEKVFRALDHLFYKARLAYYNLTLFGWYKTAPWSTTIYGRINRLHVPIRISLGKNCRLGNDLYLATARAAEIVIADDVNINLGCVLVAVERIAIGARTSIAEYVSIRDQAHRFETGLGTRGLGFKSAPIQIGENVWIGRGAFIGPGTTIGANSIVGANSVVHGTFPPNVLIAGVPATVRKQL